MARLTPPFSRPLERRKFLKAGVASGALAVTSVFPIRSRGEVPLKVGMVEPLTGAYARLAEGEVEGARLALDDAADAMYLPRSKARGRSVLDHMACSNRANASTSLSQ